MLIHLHFLIPETAYRCLLTVLTNDLLLIPPRARVRREPSWVRSLTTEEDLMKSMKRMLEE